MQQTNRTDTIVCMTLITITKVLPLNWTRKSFNRKEFEMRNIKENKLKKCIFLTINELQDILSKVYNQKIIVHAELDGCWFEPTSSDIDICDDDIKTKLSEYFDTNVTSIHIDDCECDIGVWVVYKENDIKTTAGKITTRYYDDTIAKGIQILLDDNIVAALDVYEPSNGENVGEARVLVYKKNYDENEEESPICCVSINR